MKKSNTSTRASKILRESRKEYQSILQKNISKQTGKKNVCKAAKEASKQYDKMSWAEALRIAASNGTGTKKVKKTASKPKHKKTSKRTEERISYFKRIGVTFFDELPKGWKLDESGTTAPNGYAWCNNGVSRFSNQYRIALVKIDE